MSDIRLDIDGSERHAARRRVLARLMLVMFVLAVLGVFALPTLLSTGAGNGLLLRSINQRIAGDVSLDSASVGWFSGARVRGLELHDPDGGLVVRGLDLDAGDTGFAGLLSAWWRQDASGIDAVVRVAEVQLAPFGVGGLNLRRSLGRPVAAAGEAGGGSGSAAAAGSGGGWRDTVGWTGSGIRTPPASRVDLAVERLHWRAHPGATAFGFSDLKAVVDARDPDRIQTSIEADTRHGTDSGRLTGEAALLHSSTPGGELVLREAAMEASGRVDGFPMALLSEAGWTADWTEAAFGTTADLTVDASGTLAAPQVNLSVSSEALQARLGLEQEGGGVSVVSGSGLDWTLTPAAFEAALSGRGWVLEENVRLQLAVDRLRITETAGGAQPEWASVQVGGSIGTVRLRGADGALSLEGGRVRFTSEAVGRQADLTIAATVHRGEEVDPVRLSASLENIRMPEEAGPPSFTAELVGLPTGLLSLAGPEVRDAARLLGPDLGLRFEAIQQAPTTRLRLKPDVVTAELSITSDGLSGPVAVKLEEGGRIGELNTPEPLRLRVRDESLGDRGLLGSYADVRLDEPLEATLDLREFHWSLLTPDAEKPPAATGPFSSRFAWLQRFDPEGTSLSAAFRIEEARIRGRRGGVVGFRDLVADVAAERLAGEPEVYVGGLVVPTDGPTAVLEAGTIRGRLLVGGLVDNRGWIRPDGVTLRGQGSGASLPSETLDRFVAGDGRLPALLGAVFNPSLTLDAGPGQPPRLAATLDSENAVAGLSAELREDHLELGPGARFQLAITEDGADALRGRLHPLTSDLVRGVPGYPLVLEPREGGIIRPAEGWEGWLALLNDATLDPGRLELRGDGWMIGALADSIHQRAPEFRYGLDKQIEVETTPITVKLQDGRLSHGPLWMFSPRIVLGLEGWSDALVVNEAAGGRAAEAESAEASRIKMVLGFPGALLRKEIPDADTLEAGAVYQVQVGGWIDNPIADTGRFATDLLLASGPDAMTDWVGLPADWELPEEVRADLEAMIPDADAGLLPSLDP